MKIRSIEFTNINYFKSMLLELDRTSVLVGKNDHGKSSILQTVDLLLNRIRDKAIRRGNLPAEAVERLMPTVPTAASPRRITLHYDHAGKTRSLHCTVSPDGAFAVHETLSRNPVTTRGALKILKKLRRQNRFFLLPAPKSYSGSAYIENVIAHLHNLGKKASRTPGSRFILAIEEPEAFLHPQSQKELYHNLLDARRDNLTVLVTTHSPAIIAETPFTRIGLVRRRGRYSSLHVPAVEGSLEEESLGDIGSEINNQLFFSEKVIIVEGESDLRVIRLLLKKKFRRRAQRIGVLSAAGNKNFEPFLRMLRAWRTLGIPCLIVTDFDSLTQRTHRALLTGAKNSGYPLTGETAFVRKVDAALTRDTQAAFGAVAEESSRLLAEAGLNVFVFSSDLEHALITPSNKAAAAAILTSLSPHHTDYRKGYDVARLTRLIGSKGIPLDPLGKPPFKKPFVHTRIAETIDFRRVHPDLDRLFDRIREL